MAGLRRVAAAIALPILLSACAQPQTVSDDVLRDALYAHDAPASLTLFTVISSDTGWGTHTGLMVNSAHRAIWDPAGTFYHPDAPEQNDVHFGITEDVLKVYLDFYAQEDTTVVVQKVDVSPEVAAVAMREIQAYGAAPKAHCSRSTTTILRRVPGFEDIPVSWFPRATRAAFAERPGVTEQILTADTVDTDHGVLIVPPSR